MMSEPNSLPLLDAKGSQGSWFTKIGEEHVPCVWTVWKKGDLYFDPFDGMEGAKLVRYLAAIQEGKRVALTVKAGPDGEWKRGPYEALFEIADVSATDEGLRFRFVRPLARLKRPSDNRYLGSY